MRNLLLLISMMLFLFTTLINGQETWVSFNGLPEGEADLTIQSSNSAEVVFTINLPGMYVHNEMGQKVSSGVYIYRFIIDGEMKVDKMTLAK